MSHNEDKNIQLKLKLLNDNFSSFDELERKDLPFLDVTFININFRFYFDGENQKEALSYALEYYKHFTPQEPHQNIHHKFYYYTLKEPYHTLNHEIYRSKLPYSFFQEAELGLQHINRDFCSYINNDRSQSFSVGPLPCDDNPDSLDNLLTTHFMMHLKEHNTILLHAAAVEFEDGALIFYGKSGAGKSTIAHLLYEKENLKVIGSDQIYINLKDKVLYTQSTSITIPELKNAPLNSRQWNSRKIKGIFHLDRNQEKGCHITSSKNLMPSFIAEASHYLNPYSSEQIFLELISQIFQQDSIKFGILSYDKKDSPLPMIEKVL